MARWLEGWRIVAVQDSYKLMPFADAMYGCDPRWWDIHKDCAGFQGEKWSTHEDDDANHKLVQADAYGIRLVKGVQGDEFSVQPDRISYGSNSGFQAINLALLKGCKQIVLVGYDMRTVKGQRHFFGQHPKGLHNSIDFEGLVPHFAWAAKHLRGGVQIVNATPESSLNCFPMIPLEDCLAQVAGRKDGRLYRNRTIADAGASRDGAA
jgi:hypothetical protein